MPRRGLALCLSGLVLAVAVAACSVTDSLVRPGWRHIVVSVENRSARPAVILVAADGEVMGKMVGTAEPGVVPPGATVDVLFGLPPEPNWAIFVNPDPKYGPLVTAGDIPSSASGRVPLALQVSASGELSSTVEGDLPGWMGN